MLLANSFRKLCTKFSFEKYYAVFSGKIPRKSWRRFSAHKPSMASFWATTAAGKPRREYIYCKNPALFLMSSYMGPSAPLRTANKFRFMYFKK
jgi:hypothetical protein